ncbi:uncharacterized protein BO95DRAFT_271098 [Aspergillus brunneoviolaceus CBS 621.78]|uniref:Uncharacterized protein n=2 Tax=Aspergillus subgen. Circumdati TaxID=2720871 RepID=A0ACD1GKB4_9EURO|nr:hypothetical protein BO95DRAFT_271098 [Aspergillus brunneoviolaceus CBS 621.78]RAH49701.1 hypothetical protein BO95DRAFT_271098 [Aspergillus brunneoviolaceus CBS 621.78]
MFHFLLLLVLSATWFLFFPLTPPPFWLSLALSNPPGRLPLNSLTTLSLTHLKPSSRTLRSFFLLPSFLSADHHCFASLGSLDPVLVTMSQQGYYNGPPPPQQAYGQYPPQGYQQGYPPQGGYPPGPPPQGYAPQPMQYQQQPPPQQKDRGCLGTCLATLCCLCLCEETCECCFDCIECCEMC